MMSQTKTKPGSEVFNKKTKLINKKSFKCNSHKSLHFVLEKFSLVSLLIPSAPSALHG